ncbi:MAG: hypothetical protein SGPRY_014649, partial [Prymnesium sp.]
MLQSAGRSLASGVWLASLLCSAFLLWPRSSSAVLSAPSDEEPQLCAHFDPTSEAVGEQHFFSPWLLDKPMPDYIKHFDPVLPYITPVNWTADHFASLGNFSYPDWCSRAEQLLPLYPNVSQLLSLAYSGPSSGTSKHVEHEFAAWISSVVPYTESMIDEIMAGTYMGAQARRERNRSYDIMDFQGPGHGFTWQILSTLPTQNDTDLWLVHEPWM